MASNAESRRELDGQRRFRERLGIRHGVKTRECHVEQMVVLFVTHLLTRDEEILDAFRRPAPGLGRQFSAVRQDLAVEDAIVLGVWEEEPGQCPTRVRTGHHHIGDPERGLAIRCGIARIARVDRPWRWQGPPITSGGPVFGVLAGPVGHGCGVLDDHDKPAVGDGTEDAVAIEVDRDAVDVLGRGVSGDVEQVVDCAFRGVPRREYSRTKVVNEASGSLAEIAPVGQQDEDVGVAADPAHPRYRPSRDSSSPSPDHANCSPESSMSPPWANWYPGSGNSSGGNGTAARSTPLTGW